jgi:hypothetical protein
MIKNVKAPLRSPENQEVKEKKRGRKIDCKTNKDATEEASSVGLFVFHGLLTAGLDGSIRSTVNKYSRYHSSEYHSKRTQRCIGRNEN